MELPLFFLKIKDLVDRMIFKFPTCLMVILGLAVLASTPLNADLITTHNVVDSHIEGSTILGNNDNNYGGATIFSASRNSHLWSETLLRVDDLFGSGPSQIPDLATITSAQLHVWLDTSWGNSTNTYSLYQLDTDWDEFTVTSNSYGRVTGHSNGVAIDSLAGPTSSTYYDDTEYVFDVTSSLLDWQSGTSNFGWGLTATSARNDFFSSESTNASRRPFLTVEFSPVPEPSSFLLMGCGASIVLLGRRHRRQL